MTETHKEAADSTVHLRERRHTDGQLVFRLPPTQNQGKVLYSKEEDQAIKQYVLQFCKRSSGVGVLGNKIWQEMEKKKVANRTWSSMRCRYVKYLRHMPDSYFETTEGEPDSSGSSLRPSRTKPPLCFTSNNSGHNSLGINAPKRARRRNAGVITEKSSVDDDTSPMNVNESLKRPEAALVLAQEQIDSCRTVETQDVDDGMVSSSDGSDEMSEFDEDILKMAESDLGSSSETGSSSESGNSSETTDGIVTLDEGPIAKWPMETHIDGNTLSPEQLLILENVRALRCKQSATFVQIIYSLFCTNGNLDNAAAYLAGRDTEDFWTFEDDQILLGDDEQAITKLVESRGLKKVETRIIFLGSSPGSDVDFPSQREIVLKPGSETQVPNESEVVLPESEVRSPLDSEVQLLITT